MSQPTWWRGGRGLPSLIALFVYVIYLDLDKMSWVIEVFVYVTYLDLDKTSWVIGVSVCYIPRLR